MTKRLKKMPYAQARVTIDEKQIKLVSYVTEVIIIDKETGWVTVTGLYSTTTRRHISAFVKEYFPAGYDYYTVKDMYNKNYYFNIFTGDIKFKG